MNSPVRYHAPMAIRQPVPATLPGDSELGSWRAFLQAHARLTRRLDEELQAAHGLSLGEYEALLHVAQAPGRRLRMSTLAERALLSRSGITRLVDRLVADGMVERSACPTDAREPRRRSPTRASSGCAPPRRRTSPGSTATSCPPSTPRIARRWSAASGG